ncbi:hypothetical protein RHMOL_Rhmol07G0133000 [Rhododendron molle]|uniref:Uncharacterized protein n=1 Tax=Rhododendron molle TaxID=49168 RepID=A0ACC0N1I3_RHOML|nr:hypothetical protein RHMOL_Rhmol07G0133000 [Rhododendron molle]
MEDEANEKSKEMIKLLKAAASANCDLVVAYVGVNQWEGFTESFKITRRAKFPNMAVSDGHDEYFLCITMVDCYVPCYSNREGDSVVAGLAAVSKTVWAVAEVTIVEGEKKKKKKHKDKEDGEEGRKRKLEEVDGSPAPHVVKRVKADGDEETFKKEVLCGAYGVVIQDCDGRFVAPESGGIKWCASPSLAEAMAIREGVQLGLQQGLEAVIVESDSQALVNMLNGQTTISQDVQVILADVKVLALGEWFSFLCFFFFSSIFQLCGTFFGQ